MGASLPFKKAVVTREVQVSARRLHARTRGRRAATLRFRRGHSRGGRTRLGRARARSLRRRRRGFRSARQRGPFLVNGSSRMRGTDGLGRSRRANRRVRRSDRRRGLRSRRDLTGRRRRDGRRGGQARHPLYGRGARGESDRRSLMSVSTHERAGSGNAHHQGRPPHDTDSRRPSPSRARGILDVCLLGFPFELQRLRGERRERDRLGLRLARKALDVPVDAFEEEGFLDVGDIAKRGGKRSIGQVERR